MVFFFGFDFGFEELSMRISTNVSNKAPKIGRLSL